MAAGAAMTLMIGAVICDEGGPELPVSSQLIGAQMVKDGQLRVLKLASVPDDGVRLYLPGGRL